MLRLLRNRLAATSTRCPGDNDISHPYIAVEPVLGQEHVSVQPRQLPHDDKIIPETWPTSWMTASGLTVSATILILFVMSYSAALV